MSTRAATGRIDLFGAAGVLVLTVAGYLLGVEPVFHDRASGQKDLAALEDKSRSLKIADANLHAAQMHRAKLAKAVDALPFHLEPPDALNDRMTRLTLLAEESRLTVTTSEPSAAQPTARFTATPIRLTGVCTYPTLIGFMRSLRDGFPDTRIHELHVAAAPADPPGDASFTLICTWYAAPDASAASADAPAN